MIQLPFNPWHLLPALLYAETHFRFRFIPSLLFKREPEIIFDAPHRVERGTAIPLLLLVKDARRFPVTLRSVIVRIASDRRSEEVELFRGEIPLGEKLWWRIFELRTQNEVGWHSLNARITIEVNGSLHTYANDNHRTSSKKPLRVYVSATELPTFPNLVWGEAHAHSEYTDDQVEFGSPLEPTVQLEIGRAHV